MRGSRWIIGLKASFADRPVVATAFLVVLLATTLVAAIPIYSHAVAQSSLRERLDRAPETEANVQATVNVFGGVGDRALNGRVETVARDVFSATDLSIFRSGESEEFTRGRATVVFGFFDGIAEHARLLAGRWPRSGATPVEVVLQDGVARSLDLGVGRRVRTRSRLDESRVVEARVVGVYRAERPSSVYWWGNPRAARASGPLVTTRQSFFALGFENAELRWRVEPDLGRVTIGDAAALRRAVVSMPARLNVGRESGEQFTVETKLPEILSGAERSLRLARGGVLVPSIQLALLAAYGLLVTAALLLDRRRLTTETLRLRGATAAQIVAMAVVEAAVLALPAVAVAPWLAAGTLRALNFAGPLADIGLRLEPTVNGDAYLLAAAAGVLCVAGLALPALWARRAGVMRQRRRRPVAQFAQRVGLDLVLAALALIGYWQLRRYHGFLVSHRGALDIDPFLIVAPALLLLAGALLSLRLIPLAAALVERIVPSTHGAVGALGFWQLGRRPGAYSRSVLLLVLAVAIGVFAATYSRTWHRSQVDQAAHAAGADVLVEPSDTPGAPSPGELASAYRGVGAEDALPVVTDPFDLDPTEAEETGTLLAVDAERAGGVVRVRDDFASRSLDELLRPVAAARGELAVLRLPGRPNRLALSARLEVGSGPPARAPPPGVRRGLPRSFFVYLRDGDGVVRVHRLGELPPGREKRFTVELGRARYPLGLVAFRLEVRVPFVVPRRMRLVVRSLEVTTGAEARPQRVSLSAAPWRGSASAFDQPYERPRVRTASAIRDALRVRFATGAYLYTDQNNTEPTTDVTLRPGEDSLPAPPPVLASEAFLRAVDARVGDTFPLALSAADQNVRIVGSFRRFPTLRPGTPVVVADLPTYYAFSFVRHDVVVQPSRWWLQANRDEDVAHALRGPPFRSLGVVSQTQREQALLEDPVPLGVIGALALGFVVAAAFAAVGFAASAAASARSRVLEFAVLRSLGLRTSQLSGWISLESALVVVLSLLGGTGLGLLAAWLVLPYVALSESGAEPVPPVLVSVPWELVVWLEVALLAALVVVSAVQVLRVRALRPAPVLRSSEGALAP